MESNEESPNLPKERDNEFDVSEIEDGEVENEEEHENESENGNENENENEILKKRQKYEVEEIGIDELDLMKEEIDSLPLADLIKILEIIHYDYPQFFDFDNQVRNTFLLLAKQNLIWFPFLRSPVL